tara:strand:+ start:541 stop:1053 length:513 start_codon:yes stop_codon:yes gene_type:complete
MEAKNEKRNQRLFALLCVIILSIMFAQGQVSKERSYDPIKAKYINYIYPTVGNKFASPTGMNDTITLSIKAEELGGGNLELYLWVKYPQALKADSLFPVVSLDFDNGYTCRFVPVLYYLNDNCMKYKITPEAYKILKEYKFNHVVFGELCQSFCKKPDDFFVGFFKSVIN